MFLTHEITRPCASNRSRLASPDQSFRQHCLTAFYSHAAELAFSIETISPVTVAPGREPFLDDNGRQRRLRFVISTQRLTRNARPKRSSVAMIFA
jgi:hypothetical protein